MKTILLLILISILNADIDITQNMKALYKNVKLTEIQKDYILDNQDTNIDIVQKALKKEIKQFKNLNEKNIISFILTPAGEVTKIKFLKTSNNRKLDRKTKKAITKASKVLVKPKEATEIRYIISYRVGQKPTYTNNSNETTTNNEEIYYPTISRGTTKFKHSSKEYVRIFKTSRKA